MRRWALSLGKGIAVVACLGIGGAGAAGAATLAFTGTLTLKLASLPSVVATGAGTAQVTDDGSLHLLSLAMAGGAFGPITASIPLTANATLNSVVFTGISNLTGTFTGISGGPPGGGPMGLSGIAKICGLVFAPCQYANVPIPLAPTTGGAGFGIGGTATTPGAVAVTMQHSPWTIGQPVMTIHTAGSNVTTPILPGGFAHGPASLTSSTAQPSGVLQLVSVTKAFTSLTGAFPELPFVGVMNLHLVPEPGTLLLLASGVTALALCGRRKRRR